MKSIVTRFLVIAASVALAVFGLLSAAEAQDPYVPNDPYVPSSPSPALPYDGPYTSGGSGATGALGFGFTTSPAAVAVDDEAVGGTGGGLAVTGSNADMTVAMAIGLLAAGSATVIAARKREALS